MYDRRAFLSNKNKCYRRETTVAEISLLCPLARVFLPAMGDHSIVEEAPNLTTIGLSTTIPKHREISSRMLRKYPCTRGITRAL